MATTTKDKFKTTTSWCLVVPQTKKNKDQDKKVIVDD